MSTQTTSTEVINLDPKDKVAEGYERLVFIHPDDDTRLIKVTKLRKTESYKRRNFGDLTKKYFPATRIHSVVKQYDEYMRLTLKGHFDQDFNLPISHLYGFVKTNLGWGGITERVIGPDGQNAPTLKTLGDAQNIADLNLNTLNDFVTRLYEASVCVSDINPENLVFGTRHVGRKDHAPDPEWVLIDGFGDRYAIPVRSISNATRKLGLDDAFKRHRAPSGLQWASQNRQYQYAAPQ